MKHWFTHLLSGLFLAAVPMAIRAQGVVFGSTAATPHPSALLEISSTTQGLLLPRLTAQQRAAIGAPPPGLLVYQTDGTAGLYAYEERGWRHLATGRVAGTNGSTLPLNLGISSTAAGDGTTGAADGVGPSAKLNQPAGVAVDRRGNVYIADQGNHRIRKLLAGSGTVVTLAGSGTAGFADGPGATAQFNQPTGLAVDQDGNVYVADQGNHRIRKIGFASGAVTTVAGTGTAGFANGSVAAAQFNAPADVALALNGDVYVADQGNHRVRRIAGTTVSTLAGSTAGFADGVGVAAQFNQPTGLAVAGNGTIYVADRANNRIRQIVVATRGVSTVAGGNATGTADGVGLAARFSAPSGVAVDLSGTVYVADQGNHRVRRIVGATVSTLAGSSAGFADDRGPAAQFSQPTGVAASAKGTLYITDQANHRLRVLQ